VDWLQGREGARAGGLEGLVGGGLGSNMDWLPAAAKEAENTQTLDTANIRPVKKE
jgi:hypothetical protein